MCATGTSVFSKPFQNFLYPIRIIIQHYLWSPVLTHCIQMAFPSLSICSNLLKYITSPKFLMHISIFCLIWYMQLMVLSYYFWPFYSCFTSVTPHPCLACHWFNPCFVKFQICNPKQILIKVSVNWLLYLPRSSCQSCNFYSVSTSVCPIQVAGNPIHCNSIRMFNFCYYQVFLPWTI